jgi:hypothetical protein
MPKVRIFLNDLTEDEKAALVALLEEAGCELFVETEADEEVSLAPEEEHRQDVEVVVVLITPACSGNHGLASTARRLAGSGGRLIGIWPKGEINGQVPEALNKYGADVVSWDPVKIARAIGQTEPALWETPQGSPRPEPPTERNRC